MLLEFDGVSPNSDLPLRGMDRRSVGVILGRTSIALASSLESLYTCLTVSFRKL